MTSRVVFQCIGLALMFAGTVTLFILHKHKNHQRKSWIRTMSLLCIAAGVLLAIVPAVVAENQLNKWFAIRVPRKFLL